MDREFETDSRTKMSHFILHLDVWSSSDCARGCALLGRHPSLAVEADVHSVASLLKLYLRELPEPLLTRSLHESFLGAVMSYKEDEDVVCSFHAPFVRVFGVHVCV